MIFVLTNSLLLTEIRLPEMIEPQIISGCQVQSTNDRIATNQSRLYLLGQGGFANNPSELGATSIAVPWVELETAEEEISTSEIRDSEKEHQAY